MYAIVETGGKQYRVALGEKIRIERLKAQVGSDISLENVLLVSKTDGTQIGTPRVEDFEIGAKVLEHGRGDKIRVVKMKRRKNYRRTQGHRQDYTELQITRFGKDKLGAMQPMTDTEKSGSEIHADKEDES